MQKIDITRNAVISSKCTTDHLPAGLSKSGGEKKGKIWGKLKPDFDTRFEKTEASDCNHGLSPLLTLLQHVFWCYINTW